MAKCYVGGCESPEKYKGLCGKHYKRAWRHGHPDITITREQGYVLECKEEGCARRAKSSDGYCAMHWHRLQRYGRTHRIKGLPGSGVINAGGYRVHTVNGVRKYEHIIVAEKALGKPLPAGAIVHHINNVGSDNRPENLVICPNQAYHLLIHRRMKELGIPYA